MPMPTAPRSAPPAHRAAPPPNRPPEHRGWRRARRIALAAALVCLIPVAVSYANMLSRRSDSSIGIRTVEWMRDNGARGLVNEVESVYYSLNAPEQGGPALHALPGAGGNWPQPSVDRPSAFGPPLPAEADPAGDPPCAEGGGRVARDLRRGGPGRRCW